LIVWLGLTQIIAWGSIYYLFALLIAPLERELHASRSAVSGAFSVSLLAAGLAAPMVGRLMDRVGGREVMTLGSIAAAALLVALSQVHSLVMLYVVWMALGIAMAATLYEAAFTVVTRAFPQDYRRAITAITLFGGFASTVFWPASSWLMAHMDWRGVTLCWAALNLLVCAPIHFSVVPAIQARAPAMSDTKVQPAAPDDETRPTPALPRFWRNRAFMAFALSFVGQALAISALGVHLLTLLAERGFTATDAALVGAMIGPMQVAGRAVEFTFSGRVSAVQVGRWAVVLLPVSIAILLLAKGQWFAMGLFALLYGAGNGAMTIVRGAAPIELFGRGHYGAMTGSIAAPAMLARAAGPLLAGVLWSAFGGYDALLIAMIGVSALSAVAYFRATSAAATGRATRDAS
jgi:MFS family permease